MERKCKVVIQHEGLETPSVSYDSLIALYIPLLFLYNIFLFYLIFISSFCALISLDGVLEVHHASHHSDSGLHATYNLFGYLLPLTATSDFDDCVVHVMYLLEDQKVLSDPEQAKRSRERRVSRKRRRREEEKRGGVPTLTLVLFLFLSFSFSFCL